MAYFAVCTFASAASQLEYLGTGLTDRTTSTIGDYYHANSVFYDRMNSGSVWSDIVYTILQWVHAAPKRPSPSADSSESRGSALLTYTSLSSYYGGSAGKVATPGWDAGLGRGFWDWSGAPEPDGAGSSPGAAVAPPSRPAASNGGGSPAQSASEPSPLALAQQPAPLGAVQMTALSPPRADANGYLSTPGTGSYGGVTGATGFSMPNAAPAGQQAGGVLWPSPQGADAGSSDMVPGGGGGAGGGATMEDRSFLEDLLVSLLTALPRLSFGARTSTFVPVAPVPITATPLAARPATEGAAGSSPVVSSPAGSGGAGTSAIGTGATGTGAAGTGAAGTGATGTGATGTGAAGTGAAGTGAAGTGAAGTGATGTGATYGSQDSATTEKDGLVPIDQLNDVANSVGEPLVSVAAQTTSVIYNGVNIQGPTPGFYRYFYSVQGPNSYPGAGWYWELTNYPGLTGGLGVPVGWTATKIGATTVRFTYTGNQTLWNSTHGYFTNFKVDSYNRPLGTVSWDMNPSSAHYQLASRVGGSRWISAGVMSDSASDQGTAVV